MNGREKNKQHIGRWNRRCLFQRQPLRTNQGEGRKSAAMYRSLFSTLPVKKIFPFLTGCILLLLLVVLALGARQYLLYHRCSSVVITSDKLLFEYAALQKYLSESLVADNQVNISRLGEKFERLNTMTSSLQSSTIIADSLKSRLVPRSQYVSLLADLQMMQDNHPPSDPKKTALIRQLNSISSTLQGFRLALSDHTQGILQGLHNIIIGILGLLFVISCVLLYTLNRNIGPALQRLGKIAFSPVSGREKEDAPRPDCSLDDLTRKVADIMSTHRRVVRVVASLHPLSLSIDNGEQPENMQQKICDALVTNPDFTFVWIGKVDKEQRIHPMSCSETAVSRGICLKTLADNLPHCDKEGHILHPIWKSCTTGSMVVEPFHIASFPIELGDFDDQYNQVGTCIVLPLLRNGSPVYLFSLYSPLTDPFPPEFLELLTTLLHHAFLFPLKDATPRQMSRQEQPSDRFERYFYTATGSVCTEAASSITNLINGTINYTQQLIDLSENEKSTPLVRKTLETMLVEEHKIARLTGTMLMTSGGQSTSSLSTSLQNFVNGLRDILDKPLQSRAIALTIECPQHLTLKVPISVLWLVSLTLLHLGRTTLAEDKKAPAEKSITIKCQEDSGAHLLNIHYTNSSGQWNLPVLQNHPLWPSLDYCTQVMQQYHGDIHRIGNAPLHPDKIVLSVPY